MRPGSLIVFLLALTSANAASKHAALDYLQTFGYLQPEPLTGSSDEEDDEIRVELAIREFQSKAGLLKTGELDTPTLEKMAKPRCGVPDVAPLTSGKDTRFKWNKIVVSYSIEDYWPGLSQGETRRVIWEAFQAWQKVVPFSIAETHAGQGDIKIRFCRKEQGGCNHFDGPGKTLARVHARFMLHLDSDETWAEMRGGVKPDRSQVDLFTVAVHQIGHALGLDHAFDKTSIMDAYYHEPVDAQGRYERPTLDQAAITMARSLYGTVAPLLPSRSPAARAAYVPIPLPLPKDGDGFLNGRSKTSHHPKDICPPTKRTDLPEYCLRSVVAIARIPGDRILAFPNSKEMITVNAKTKHIIAKSPVSNIFLVQPLEVSAAIYSANDAMLIVFNGNMVFGYTLTDNTFRMTDGYPKVLKNHHAGVSSWKTDAAFILPDGRRVLVSTEKRFAFYNEKTNTLKIMDDAIDDHFPNMPKDIVGFVEFHQGTHVGFTATDVFKYDFETHSMENLGKIHAHMGC